MLCAVFLMNVWICPDFWVLRPIAASKFCPIKTCFIRENNYCSELRCVKNREVRKKNYVWKIISDVPVLDMNLGKKLIQTKWQKNRQIFFTFFDKKKIFEFSRPKISISGITFFSFLAPKSNFEKKYPKSYFGFF